MMLKFGALTDSTDEDGHTALHIATGEYERGLSITVALLRAGASSDIKDLYGRRALDHVPADVRYELYRALERKPDS